LVGLTDLTRVNGLNGRDGLVSEDNFDVGRFRSENKECVMRFGAGGAIAVGVVADDDVVAAGDVTVGDVGADDAVVGAVVVGGAVDDAADFDDNFGKPVVYYDDFDNNFDIDALVDNYSLWAYDVPEQVLRWLFQGVGTQGALGSWNSSLVGNSHGLDKHLGPSIFVLGLDFGEKGFGLDVPLKWLDLYRMVGIDQSGAFAVDDGCSVVVLVLLDGGGDID